MGQIMQDLYWCWLHDWLMRLDYWLKTTIGRQGSLKNRWGVNRGY